MNKYISILLLIFGLSVSLAQGQVSLKVDDKAVFTGDEFDLPVVVETTLTSKNVLSYQLAFNYSSSLEGVSISSTGTLTSSWGAPTFNIDKTNRIIYVSGAGATALAGTGTLINIKFKALSANSFANVDFRVNENSFNEGNPALTLKNGRVTITNVPTLAVNSNSGVNIVLKGETLTYTASAGTAPYTYSVEKNTIGSINAAGIFTAAAVGFTKILAEDSKGVKGNTTIETEVRGFRLSIPDSSVFVNKKLLIPIRTTDLTGQGIVSGDINITHGTNTFKLLRVITEGTVLAGADISYNAEQGTTNISFARATPITGSGKLLILEIEGISSTGLTLQNITFNESLKGIAKNAFLQVKPLVNLSVSANKTQIKIGEKLQYTVSGGEAPYTWSVTNAASANINTTGLLTAKSGGTLKVKVQDINGSTGESPLLSVYDSEVSVAEDGAALLTSYELPIRIDTIPAGTKVYGIELTFSYRKPELLYKSVVQTNSLTEGWSISENALDGDTYKIALANANGITKSGILFYLKFDLTADLTLNEIAAVNIDQVQLNEGSPVAISKNGYIKGLTCVPPTAPTVTGADRCGSGTVTLTAAGTPAGGTYRWYTTSSGGTPITSATTATYTTPNIGSTTTYYVSIVNANDCESARTAVTATINTLPSAPTVTATVTYCQNGISTALTATGSDLKWYTTATDGTALTSGPLPATTTAGTTEYFVSQTVNGCESTRSKITVTINAPPAAPAVAAQVEYCQGATAAALSAAGTGLKWYTTETGGTGSATAPTPVTSASGVTNYYVSQTISGCESTRALITVTIAAPPTAPTATGGTSCGPGSVTLTASGGSAGNYRWYTVATGGTAIANETNATYGTPSISATTTYYVSVVGNGCESARTAVTATVGATLSAPTVIAASICGPGSVTLTAAGSTLGNYRWYTTATGGTAIVNETNATYVTPNLTATTTYYVAINNGTCETSRTAVTAIINTLPNAPTVTATISLCQNEVATALTASGTSLKWYTVATGGTALSSTPTPVTTIAGTTNYYVSQTVNGCEGPRAQIAVTVNAIPAAPTVTAGASCGTGTVTLAAAGGSAGNYRWYTTATGGTALANGNNATFTTPSLTNTTTYYVSVVNGTCEGSRTPVTATITLAPTVINGSTCNPGPLTLTAEGGSAGSYRWYTAATGGTAIANETNATYTPNITATSTYYVAINNGTCETTRTAVTATIGAPAAPTVTGATSCGPGSVTLTAAGGAPGSYRWYTVATGGTAIANETNATYGTPNLTATTTYYVAINNGCESTRTAVIATIGTPSAAPTVISASNCGSATLVLSAAGAPNGATYRWYTTATGGTPIANQTASTYTTPLLTATANYYVAINNGTCETARTAVTATIGTPATAPTVTGASSCGPGSVTLTASGGSAGNYRWYTIATGGTPITNETGATFLTPNLSATTTYYVSINNGCESSRTPVTATISATVAAPTITGAAICGPGTVTLTAAGGSAGGYRWYTTATGGTAIAGATNATFTTPSLTATTIYYAAINNGTCETSRTAVTATINAIPAKPTFTAALNGSNANVLTSSSATNNQWLLNGAEIPGATGVTHTVTQPGLYSVKVTVNGCSNTSDERSQTITSIKEISELAKALIVYPNPADRELNISLPLTSKTDLIVRLLDMKGRTVVEKAYSKKSGDFTGALDLSNEAKGVYLLQLITEKEVISKQIAVQ